MLTRAKPLLGTLVEIRAHADSPASALAASSAAFDAVAEIHRLMSFHDAASDVRRLNALAHLGAVTVHEHTFAVLRRAQQLSAWSRGMFDCTVGARLMQLGYLPGAADAIAREGASYRDVHLLADRRVRFARPLALDLGGIAKGYAVDVAVDSLRRSGATAGLVNAGGDLRGFGPVAWPIAMRDPRIPTRMLTLCGITDEAIATTADYFAARESRGEWINPIIDPATQRSTRDDISVSVIAPNCMDADALTKIVWLSPELPRQLLKRLNARAIVVGESTRKEGVSAHGSVAAK